MTSCLRLSQTPATSATASLRNGSTTTSTLMSSTSIGCPKTSPIWLSNGRAALLSSAAVPPDPRYSPDAYLATRQNASNHRFRLLLGIAQQLEQQQPHQLRSFRPRFVYKLTADATCDFGGVKCSGEAEWDAITPYVPGWKGS